MGDIVGAAGPVTLSYIVPAHNSVHTIERTLRELGRRFSHRHAEIAEIIVVENGSTDETPALLRRVAAGWPRHGVGLRVLTAEKGLGNALRLGIAESRGDRVFLGADDLPFGFDDLDASARFDHAEHPVVVGSKAHPESEIDRSFVRGILTFGFLALRAAILGMRTRDPQGTFALDGPWARRVVGRLDEPGFLLTTELVYLAETSGIRPVEVPVRLRDAHAAHGSRIRVGDVWRMGVGLLALRRRHRTARAEATAPLG